MDKRGWRGVLAGLLVALAALGLASAAPAKPRHVVKPAGFGISFALQGSNGYGILVASEGHRRVRLTARKSLFYSASYTVPGWASSKGIEADFGELGRISVRFDASAPRKGRRGHGRICKGRPTIARQGWVRGTIRFAGEHGFTTVDAKRARGGFSRSFRRACKRSRRTTKFRPPQAPGAKPPSLEFEYSALAAISKSEGVRHEFFAFSSGFEFSRRGKIQTFSLTVLGAASHERRDRVTIQRDAVELADEGAFIVNDPGAYPAVATVTLPKPFSGTATYRQETAASPSTWTGSLAVRLPGSGPVPLTGESFESILCRTRSERRVNACLRKLVPLPGGSAGSSTRALMAPTQPQGSGSHSQPLADVRLSWSR
jgi:hypothetical protein